MLNILEMVADATEAVNKFKNEALESLEKGYSRRLEKIAEVEKEISEIPNKYAGKSRVFIEKKRNQMMDKLDKLKNDADEWLEQRKKEILDQAKTMLEEKKNAAQKAYEDEIEQIRSSDELASEMAS